MNHIFIFKCYKHTSSSDQFTSVFSLTYFLHSILEYFLRFLLNFKKIFGRHLIISASFNLHLLFCHFILLCYVMKQAKSPATPKKLSKGKLHGKICRDFNSSHKKAEFILSARRPDISIKNTTSLRGLISYFLLFNYIEK